jgi:hypothetical protein
VFDAHGEANGAGLAFLIGGEINAEIERAANPTP